MSAQPGLFDHSLLPFRSVDAAPLARSTDPVTSHIAADRLRKSGSIAPQVAETIAAVRAFPGRTTHELSVDARMDRYVLAKRVSVAERMGLIQRGAKRPCSITGFPAEPWSPVVPEGSL